MPSEKNSNERRPDLVHDAATQEIADVLQRLKSSPAGLTEAEAADRLEVFGPNEVGQEKRHEWLHRLWTAVRNPLVILLTVLAAASFVSYFHDAPDDRDISEFYAGIMMLVMVALGVTLRFVQETKADNAAAKLKAMIHVTATVLRDGQPREIPLQNLVPGDIVKLSAGDMIPGDVRLLSAKDLFIIQATLTGESLPVEKSDACDLRTNIAPTRTYQYLLPRHERRKRLRHRRHRHHRRADLFRQNGQHPRRPADSKPPSTRASKNSSG